MARPNYKKGPKRDKYSDQQIIHALEQAQGSCRQAAFALGIPPRTMQVWAKSLKKQVKKSDTLPGRATLKPKAKKRYVVTSAQNNTPVEEPFFNALLSYCRHNDAELLIIPIRYKNPTAYVTREEIDNVWWPREILPYCMSGNVIVNDNLIIMGDSKIQATELNPLSGIHSVAGNKSAIFGHGQIQMTMIPTPQYELPRQLLTTGSISKKNYSKSKQGMKAAFHHSLAACIVEVDGDAFYTRQLNSGDDGSFYDINGHYLPDGTVLGYRAAGIVFGDLHNDFIDEGVKAATWTDSDSIVKVTDPENEYYHDALDFYSANHHHKFNSFTKFAKHHSGMGNVQNELDRLVKTHNEIFARPGTNIHYVASNHNDALGRWLNDADFREDPENAILFLSLSLAVYQGIKFSKHGTSVPNPLALYMKPRLKNRDNTFFHDRDEKVMLFDIDLSQHGDIGANGSRGGLSSFARSGYKSITGHSHTPGIEKGAYRVGTSSLLALEYNRSGYSSWFHTHCLIYPNGKRTLINIIKGKWRLS